MLSWWSTIMNLYWFIFATLLTLLTLCVGLGHGLNFTCRLIANSLISFPSIDYFLGSFKVTGVHKLCLFYFRTISLLIKNGSKSNHFALVMIPFLNLEPSRASPLVKWADILQSWSFNFGNLHIYIYVCHLFITKQWQFKDISQFCRRQSSLFVRVYMQKTIHRTLRS